MKSAEIRILLRGNRRPREAAPEEICADERNFLEAGCLYKREQTGFINQRDGESCFSGQEKPD